MLSPLFTLKITRQTDLVTCTCSLPTLLYLKEIDSVDQMRRYNLNVGGLNLISWGPMKSKYTRITLTYFLPEPRHPFPSILRHWHYRFACLWTPELI